ncbi:rRNA maturation RNase YbeY [Natronospira bacteriovora]|uniref:Endoribonuclease YbeY n=1 Tax=Natronospira bacteriovora TaxID=3069753 RepID=A0ABU0W6K8_9GAMM|nr:rRNA maturation RNase YbeY [Natronospira sp. AB-CW4]MDQ2069665.1 rRNA maturation RNase YbeY [Natronospira sp. AB-CW4]
MSTEAPQPHDDEPPPPGLSLDVDYACPSEGLPGEDDFRHWAETALALALESDDDRPQTLEVALRLVEAEESRALNHQWRDRDRPTNVLSFPGEHLPGLPWRHLGDLVICASVVAREAAEQNKQEAAHWAHMLIHGLLHLLGHDHQQDEEAEIMEDLERRILAELGFPNPYEETRQKHTRQS